jgi:hypothetical protein
VSDWCSLFPLRCAIYDETVDAVIDAGQSTHVRRQCISRDLGPSPRSTASVADFVGGQGGGRNFPQRIKIL